MIATLDTISAPALGHAESPVAVPTLWGLSPQGLHDHFWAARGVCVVRPGRPEPIPDEAELFLLTDSRTLAIFRLRPVLDTLFWVQPTVLFVRIQAKESVGYRETISCDAEGRFAGLKRSYRMSLPRLAKVAITVDRALALQWQETLDAEMEWRRLRRHVRNARREVAAVRGKVYDQQHARDVARFVCDLVDYWKDPSSTIPGIRRVAPGVWADENYRPAPRVHFIGKAWIGAGRFIDEGASVCGPAALWDEASARPQPPALRWREIEPSEADGLSGSSQSRPHPRRNRAKRLFDIGFSALALLLTAIVYPFVMLAIWLEDGRPFFFGHVRETIGGREFKCWKFRSMRKDAEQIKEQLKQLNQADGPQFFIQDDPRLTRVGRIIRKFNLDELPQFFNVLVGEMSVVGPRPSPHHENQFCPAWREARLSVRPGITGLWQVRRTRRAGSDFQEWIKYDIDYVQRRSWRLDLLIILQTFKVLIGW